MQNRGGGGWSPLGYAAGLLRNWGSGGDGRLRVTVVGSLEALPEAAAERAIVDGAADLEQPVGGTRRADPTAIGA